MTKSFLRWPLNSALLLVVVAMLGAPGVAWSTAQFPDTLIYEGQTLYIFSNPLESFFDAAHPRPDKLFPPGSTACWRGYVATWKIESGSLYLVKMEDCTSRKKEIGLSAIFPDRQKPVLADWYTGSLRAPQGKVLRYVHMGYGSVYEREVVLTIDKGKLTGTEVVDNTAKKVPSEEEQARDQLRKLGEWEDNIRKNRP